MRTEEDIRREVAQMRLEGYNYNEICDRLDIPPSAVGRHVRELKRIANEAAVDDAQAIRLVEELRLAMLIRHYWPEAIAGNEKAAEVVIKAHNARSKLWNLPSIPTGSGPDAIRSALLEMLAATEPA